MDKRFGSRVLVLAIVIPIILGLGATAALCIEPPGGIKYSGKSIGAVLTATIVHIEGHAVVVEVLVTSCQGIPFVFGPYVNRNVSDPSALLNLTAQDLLDKIVGVAPPGCFSDVGGEDLGISRVLDFYNATTVEQDPDTGGYIYKGALGADVSLQVASY